LTFEGFIEAIKYSGEIQKVNLLQTDLIKEHKEDLKALNQKKRRFIF